LGLTVRQRLLHVVEQLVHLFGVPNKSLRDGSVAARAGVVATGVAGQEARYHAMGGEHRLDGIARLVAEYFGQLGLEASRPLGLGFAPWTRQIGDQGVQDFLR
jgi:hypothetical protein